MTLQELRDRRRGEILRVAAHRGAWNVRVFGSVARGDNDEKSDFDFPVEMEPGRTLFDLSVLLLVISRIVAGRDSIYSLHGSFVRPPVAGSAECR